jgi:hypothetical protein
MDSKSKDIIIIELQERIRDANNIDNHDEAFALENFYEWFLESFVY